VIKTLKPRPVSQDFPPEAMKWLIAVAGAFDIFLMFTGLLLAAAGRVAGGLGVAAIGSAGLLAVALIEARVDREG